ncbi:hypothetical protein BCR33DRAFT_718897 [Rhizoclosmatium globosum]|uniref:Uncharacterized protein n=1 Tax=Rhizoclosmatium globosum TaxID=329046 RepID=A0A1Y2C2I3_9FUNG|nr:hypothetical protein BCR33DRAFT_718897 [Rhizoclosmatium globosum]|eukprot:ORY41248.1 hypothetical protein BCR33DRAFT_718897 [Rhizoclosmatium globosum]
MADSNRPQHRFSVTAGGFAPVGGTVNDVGNEGAAVELVKQAERLSVSDVSEEPIPFSSTSDTLPPLGLPLQPIQTIDLTRSNPSLNIVNVSGQPTFTSAMEIAGIGKSTFPPKSRSPSPSRPRTPTPTQQTNTLGRPCPRRNKQVKSVRKLRRRDSRTPQTSASFAPTTMLKQLINHHHSHSHSRVRRPALQLQNSLRCAQSLHRHRLPLPLPSLPPRQRIHPHPPSPQRNGLSQSISTISHLQWIQSMTCSSCYLGSRTESSRLHQRILGAYYRTCSQSRKGSMDFKNQISESLTADLLVEEGQYRAASNILRGVIDTSATKDAELYSALARIELQIGNMAEASKWIQAAERELCLKQQVENTSILPSTDFSKRDIILTNRALFAVASSGDWKLASTHLTELLEYAHSIQPPPTSISSSYSIPVIVNNISVCHLYSGNVAQALSHLESLMLELPQVCGGSASLVFNLATLYDLTDNSMERKRRLLGGVVASYAGDDLEGGCLKL